MRDFLKYTFASLVALGIYSTLGIAAFFLLLVGLLSSSGSGPQVKDRSVLTFDLSTRITDAQPTSSTNQVIQEALSDTNTNTISLKQLLNSIDKAAKDSKIVGLYLHGNLSSGGAGFATLREVRQALERFRATGKTIVAYDMAWRESEYYLASIANKVVINPFGSLEINGFRSEATFLAGALQKYGIGVQVARVGRYKSAVEPFLLTKSSPESRQQTQELLNDLWGEYLSSVGEQRKISVPKLQQVTDSKGILLADEALQLKLVDKVSYLDEVITDLKKLTGSDEADRTFRQINMATYSRTLEDGSEKNTDREVAVLYAEGEIVDGQGERTEVGGDRFARQLRNLRLDKDVKAVVLRVNSPGGSVTASEVIQREVILTQKVKPVIVSMGDVAASGGYWIATYAERIFAEPTTITGSIGVFGLSINVQNLANRNGITWDVVKTGRYADSATISRPKRPDEIQFQQRIVDQIYDQFLKRVAESRKLSRQSVESIAEGRVWSGKAAQKVGLVDEMGGLEVAIRYAAKKANLGDNWQVKEYPQSRSFEDRLLKRLSGDPASEMTQRMDPVTIELGKVWKDLKTVRSLNDPTGVYLRLPYNLRIE
ncbi:MAG: signal peptide peptidase SppA [Leptolyngbyaceae cyanobacterium bins.59]|nr:signal peptide peptidase SppA [Leptolyngbyaceae cyanobacterium bins.59]